MNIEAALKTQEDSYRDYQYPVNLALYAELFSKKRYDCSNELDIKYNWKDIGNIPDCCLFEFPDRPIEFKRPPVATTFDIIELPLDEVLSTLGRDRYVLSLQRWFRVRKQISRPLIEYPEITLDRSGNTPRLMDGRHRIIAMMKFFKLGKAPFVCHPKYTKTVNDYYYGKHDQKNGQESYS